MDILLSKLLHLLSLAALVIISVSFCGVVILVIRLSLGRMDKAAQNRVYIIWVSVIGSYLLLLGATMLLLHLSAWHRFDTIMARKPNRLVISSEGKTNEISDRVVVDEFFRIVTYSKKVTAHHSHTVSKVTLLFPQSGYTYSLARDSQYPNEFWFDWRGTSGRGRDWLDVGASLGQLRSDELARWIQKYSPTEIAQNSTAK